MDIKMQQNATEQVDYKVIEEIASLRKSQLEHNTEDFTIQGNLSLSTDYCFEDTARDLQGSNIQITAQHYLDRLDPYFEKFLYRLMITNQTQWETYKNYFHDGHWIIDNDRPIFNISLNAAYSLCWDLAARVEIMDFSKINLQYLDLKYQNLANCRKIICPPHAIGVALSQSDFNAANLNAGSNRSGQPALEELVFGNNPDLLYVAGIGYTKLTTLTIPDSVTKVAGIGNNPLLTTLHLGNSVELVGTCENNKKLVNVNAPASLITLDTYAFSACTSLPEFDLTHVQTVGRQAFYQCYNLQNFYTFENLVTIVQQAFNQCFKAETDVVLKNVTSLQSSAFDSYNRDATEPVSVTFDCPDLQDSAIQSNGTSTQQAWFANSGLDTLIFTNNVQLTTIPYRSFYNCRRLSNVTLNSTITTIEQEAFLGCSQLTSFDFSNITKIGQQAFKNAALTGDVDFSNVTEIGPGSFVNTNINITAIHPNLSPETFQGTGTYRYHILAEAGEQRLSYDNIKQTTKLYNTNAIFWQGKTNRIGYSGDETVTNVYDFDESTGTLTIYTPYIETSAFVQNKKIKKVVSSTLQRVKESTFAGCSKLAEFDCPNAMAVGYGWFHFNNTNLVKVRFGGTATGAGEYLGMSYEGCRVEITSDTCDFSGTGNAYTAGHNTWGNISMEILLPDTVITLTNPASVPPLYEFYVSSTSVKNAYLADAKWSQITNASNRFHLKTELKEIEHQHIDTVNFTSGTTYSFALAQNGKRTDCDMYCFPVTEGDIVLFSPESGPCEYYLLQDTLFDNSNVLASLYSTWGASTRNISSNGTTRIIVPAGVNYLGVNVNRTSWIVDIDRYYRGSNYLTV